MNSPVGGLPENSRSPSHRSRISELVWKGFASGETAGWFDGVILPSPDASAEDAPHLSQISSLPKGGRSRPDWIKALINALDLALPGCEELLDVLDDDSLTIRMECPAFKLPCMPTAEDAAACLVASRVLLKCRQELVPPLFASEADTVLWVEDASALSLMLGGESGYLIAKAIVSDPRNFVVWPDSDEGT